MADSTPRTLFTGTFIDLPPTPSSSSTLLPENIGLRIRTGLLWTKDETGAIEGVDFEAQDLKEQGVQEWIEKKGWKVDAVKVVKGAVLGEKVDQSKGRLGFWFPGFVDTHIHAPQYPNVGIFGATTLLSWLTTYTFPLESSFSNLSKARKIYSRVVDRTLSQGTTTASYFATVHVEATNLLADLCLEKGQRAFIGRVCMDNPETCPDFYVDENPEDAVAKSRASVQHIKSIDPTGNLIGATITPRFAPSCTRDALSGLGALAAEDESLRIQTHISENSGEIAWVKELFPEHETYAAVYDAHKLLTAKTVLAHGVHLSDSEVALVKERGSSVSHCPSSNSSLSSGMCAVRRLLDAGVPVGLGTDVSGGYAASLLEAVRQTVMVSRLVNYTTGEERDKLSFIEALWLATRGGARCLALDAVEGGVGGFDIGRKMDAQEIVLGGVVGEEGEKDVVAKGKVDIFGWEAREDVVAKWVWNGDDRNVNSVFVGGKCSFEQK